MTKKKLHSIVIQNKLEELIANDRQTSTSHSYEPYKLLRDMKEQQDLNEKTLTFIRRRLILPEKYYIFRSMNRF